MNMLNREGDKTLPCLTPEVTEKQYEKQLPQRTLTNNLLYQFSKRDTMGDGIPACNKESNSLLCTTLSKAFLMSKEAINTELPLLVKWSTVVLRANIASVCLLYTSPSPRD